MLIVIYIRYDFKLKKSRCRPPASFLEKERHKRNTSGHGFVAAVKKEDIEMEEKKSPFFKTSNRIMNKSLNAAFTKLWTTGTRG